MLFLQLLLQRFNLGAIMAITANNTTLTFNDATTQTTSAVTAVNVSTGISSSGGKTPTLTNTGVTSVSGAGTVSVSASTGAITITGTGGSGTVTSVATGNGLSGGTITTTGTLVVACPAANTVGSYATLAYVPAAFSSISFGSNYAAGGASTGQVQVGLVRNDANDGTTLSKSNLLSGTWKWLGASFNNDGTSDRNLQAVGCRVS